MRGVKKGTHHNKACAGEACHNEISQGNHLLAELACPPLHRDHNDNGVITVMVMLMLMLMVTMMVKYLGTVAGECVVMFFTARTRTQARRNSTATPGEKQV